MSAAVARGAEPAAGLVARRWPLVVVGGGPAAALQLHRAGAARPDTLVVADRLGGGMGFMGPLRLQSYTEELSVGLPVAGLRAALGPGEIQPRASDYDAYVRDAVTGAGATVAEGRVDDVVADDRGLVVRARVGDRSLAIAADAVVLATGTRAKPPPAGWAAAGARPYDAVVADLAAGVTAPYAGRPAVVVGAGNSALQAAALLGTVATDVTILANRYVGLYPQETSERFAWRAHSQLTCELVTKSALRCRHSPRFMPCVRFLVYDRLDVGADGGVRFTYRAERNTHVLGASSLPPRCSHLFGRYRPDGPGRWVEHRPPGTVVAWATGVEPVYPPGPTIAALPRRPDGTIVADERGATPLPGLYVTGACAGAPSVNEMRPAVLPAPAGGPVRPVTFRLSSRRPNGATHWVGGFCAQ